MKVEVSTPTEFLGTVMGDISARRGQILGTHEEYGMTIINAEVPLESMTGYATTIRSLTQGRGSFYMEPSHYAQVPRDVQEKLSKPAYTA